MLQEAKYSKRGCYLTSAVLERSFVGWRVWVQDLPLLLSLPWAFLASRAKGWCAVLLRKSFSGCVSVPWHSSILPCIRAVEAPVLVQLSSSPSKHDLPARGLPPGDSHLCSAVVNVFTIHSCLLLKGAVFLPLACVCVSGLSGLELQVPGSVADLCFCLSVVFATVALAGKGAAAYLYYTWCHETSPSSWWTWLLLCYSFLGSTGCSLDGTCHCPVLDSS